MGAGNRGWGPGQGHVQDKGLVPDRIKRLAFDLGAVGLLFRDGVPHHSLLSVPGHRAALRYANPLLDAQQAVGVTKPWQEVRNKTPGSQPGSPEFPSSSPGPASSRESWIRSL